MVEVRSECRGVPSFSGKVVEDVRLRGNEIQVLVLIIADIVHSIELLKLNTKILSRSYRDASSHFVQLGQVSNWTKTR